MYVFVDVPSTEIRSVNTEVEQRLSRTFLSEHRSKTRDLYIFCVWTSKLIDKAELEINYIHYYLYWCSKWWLGIQIRGIAFQSWCEKLFSVFVCALITWQYWKLTPIVDNLYQHISWYSTEFELYEFPEGWCVWLILDKITSWVSKLRSGFILVELP